MFQHSIEIHPVYGAVPADGEFVRRGAVIGVSTDAKDIVVAPASGWIRLRREMSNGHTRRRHGTLRVEIWDRPFEPAHALPTQAVNT